MFLNRIDGTSHCLCSLLHCILFVQKVVFQKQFVARKMKNDNLQYIVTWEGLVTSITETYTADIYYTILEIIIFYKYNLIEGNVAMILLFHFFKGPKNACFLN